MFTLSAPLWFNTYRQPSGGNSYPGIFLYMKDAVMWTGYESLIDLIRVCTPNKALKQHFTQTVDGFEAEILKSSKESRKGVKASLTWAYNAPGHFFLRICENTIKPSITYVLVLEFTPQGNLERIVRSFTLSESTYPNKKG